MNLLALDGAYAKIEILLIVIAALLFLMLLQLGRIAARLKEKFPTAKEEDYQWSQNDPEGHHKAHKNDKGK